MKYFVLSLALCCLLAGCGGEEAQAPDPTPTPVIESQPLETSAPYEDIAELFYPFAVDQLRLDFLPQRLQIKIPTDLPAGEAAPDGWAELISAFDTALADAHTMGQTQGYPTVAVELVAADGQILASGFNGGVKFDFYGERIQEGQQANPATITLDEFAKIQIGMSISDVETIIGGPGLLDSEYGEIGGTVPLTQTYVWHGTDNMTSAYIHFEDYMVTIKQQFGLE